MTDLTLEDEELADLKALLSEIIPANEEYRVPGAGDDRIVADVLKSAGAAFPLILAGLAKLDTLVREHCDDHFANLASNDRTRLAEAFRTASPEIAGLLSVLTAQCYYRDSRVMLSLAMEARPPFPQGFEVEEGDWSLLDPVRERSEFYRKVP